MSVTEKVEKAIEIKHSLAGDDSCRMQLYARGHHDAEDFRAACVIYFAEWDRRVEPCKADVRCIYWRTVKAPADNSVSDFMFVESSKGRGAYPVTVLDCWYPL